MDLVLVAQCDHEIVEFRIIVHHVCSTGVSGSSKGIKKQLYLLMMSNIDDFVLYNTGRF